jgi:hypothetical protein
MAIEHTMSYKVVLGEELEIDNVKIMKSHCERKKGETLK